VLERTDLSNGLIGDEQKRVIVAGGEALKKNGVIGSGTDVPGIVEVLVDPHYARDVVASPSVDIKK